MDKYKTKTDEEIAYIAQNDDAEAYSELVERYQTKLARYVNYLAQNEQIADDVVQEALIKGFVNLQSFKIEKKFSSWIYRITHNEAINHVKRQRKSVSLETIGDIFNSPSNTEFEYEKEEAASILKQYLNEMSAKYAEALILYYLEDKSYEEISDILRMPIGTVGTRINRGKKLLKEI